MVTQYQVQIIIHKQKKGWKFIKGFQNMELNIICVILGFKDFINPLVLVVMLQDISICTIHISLILGTQNYSTWVPLLKLQLNKINEQNHKRALGAREGVPNEDATWEYIKNFRIQTWNFLRTINIEWGVFFMSPIK